jgi:hypothetical protein
MRYCHTTYTSRANFIFCLIFNNLDFNIEQLAGTDLHKMHQIGAVSLQQVAKQAEPKTVSKNLIRNGCTDIPMVVEEKLKILSAISCSLPSWL